MKVSFLIFVGLLFINCQNKHLPINKTNPMNEIVYSHNGVEITRIDIPGETRFYYGNKERRDKGFIYAKYSGINDGFKGYLKFEDNGKVFLLSGDGYFQGSNLDTSKLEYKRIYAYDEVNVGRNVCHIMLSTRYEQEFNKADSTGIVIHYKLNK